MFDRLITTSFGEVDLSSPRRGATATLALPRWSNPTGARHPPAAIPRLDSPVGAEPGRFAGTSLRDLFGPLNFVRLPAPDAGTLPPWFDCDTEDDLRRAEEWLTR